MPEILFYHLQRQPLDAVLPGLLERCLERGWRTVVEAGSPERAEALDAMLWTYSDASFLPHGTWREADPAAHPILITADASNANQATVRFLVDGALPGEVAPYQRVVLLFDGTDPDALDAARGAWKRLKAEGHDATYWQQSDSGKWEKRG